MAEDQIASGSSTVTVTKSDQKETQSMVLKLRKPKTQKKVQWEADTIDNEFMGKKSSKCCCVYEKPQAFGESSSENESEGENGSHNAYCSGHRRRHKSEKKNQTGD